MIPRYTTKEQVEMAMFSALNQLIKRDYYTQDEQELLRSLLKALIKRYNEVD